MTSLGDLVRLTDAEYADLNVRVDRFHAAWRPDGPAQLEAFLPAAGERHRPFVLVELIKTDLERRAQDGLPVLVETYLDGFRDDLPARVLPVSLIAEEYRLRHRHADKPDLDDYRRRFPAQYDALLRHLGDPAAATARPRERSVGFETNNPAETPVGGLPKRTTRSGVIPPQPRLSPQTASGILRGSGAGRPEDSLPADVNYKLIRRIGKGAFGEVYEADAPGGFKVAVKKIMRSVDHPASQGELEALEAIKTLSHPFLLHTSAYWVFEDQLIIVMELAEGSLADRIEVHKKRGLPGVPTEELVPFFEQAAEALDYLHSRDVSHRDVKPENLLLLRGYAKVADFGLARHHEHNVTTIPIEVGTPLYMAPEVWNGNVTYRSDQYSLAATYVAARLGRSLFSTRLLHELAQQHMHRTPDLSPLPAAEQKVLLKALAKNPEDRYPNCAAFARALRAAVFPPPPPARWPVYAAASFAALLGLTVAAALFYRGNPDTDTKDGEGQKVAVGVVDTPPKEKQNQTPVPDTIPVFVETTPPGAKVLWLSGGPAGATRTPGPFALQPGTHTARLELDGYEPAEVVIDPAKAAKYTVALTPEAVTVRIVSRLVSGCDVSIDGMVRGRTPLELKLRPGKYVVAVTGPGGTAQARVIDVGRNRGEDFTWDVGDDPQLIADLRACDDWLRGGGLLASYLRTAAGEKLPRWQTGADAGSPAGQVLVGHCLAEGAGVDRKDEAGAVELYRTAAAAGHPAGAFWLGVMHQFGRGNLRPDEQLAADWFRKAAALEYAAAMYSLGKLADERGKGGSPTGDAEAVGWYRKAAGLDYAAAVYNLGVMTEQGRGGLTGGRGEAVRLYRRAAELGDADAMHTLGAVVFTAVGGKPGEGLLRQAVEASAARWFRAAAEARNPSPAGMYKLGLMYELGLGGLGPDQKLAQTWYRKAAALGHREAGLKLGG